MKQQLPFERCQIASHEMFYNGYAAWVARIAGFLPPQIETAQQLMALRADYCDAGIPGNTAFYADPLGYARRYDLSPANMGAVPPPGSTVTF